MISKKKLLYIFIFSFCLRLFFIIFLYQHPEKAFEPDSFGYVELAENLTDQHTFPSIFRTPVYPFFIATVYSVFGKFPQAILIVQYFLDSVTAIFIPLIFYRIFGNVKYSYISGLFYAINPFAIFYSNLILTETLFTCILTLSVYFLILFLRNQQMKYLISSSFLLGIGTLCRPISLYLPLLLVAFVLTIGNRMKDKIINCLIFLMIFYITLLPWYIRNYQKYDFWTLSAISDKNIFCYEAPAILMYKSNPFLKIQFGMDKILEEYRKNMWAKIRAKYGWDNKSPFEIGNEPKKLIILREEGLKVIQENPLSFLVIHLNGIGRTLFPFYPYFNKLIGHESKIIKLLSFFIDFIIMGLFLWGLIVYLKDCTRIGFITIAGITMIILVFYFSFLPGFAGYSRFRIPVVPYISIFAALGLWRLPRSLKLGK
jgi:4-amino-4-deoxy-L-arabinose transferase-like glycosyltransferase